MAYDIKAGARLLSEPPSHLLFHAFPTQQPGPPPLPSTAWTYAPFPQLGPTLPFHSLDLAPLPQPGSNPESTPMHMFAIHPRQDASVSIARPTPSRGADLDFHP
eukprot:364982-Chlamydomonas_euryale.AAC.7